MRGTIVSRTDRVGDLRWEIIFTYEDGRKPVGIYIDGLGQLGEVDGERVAFGEPCQLCRFLERLQACRQ